MVTVEQILAAEGYELGDLLGQVLKPDEYEWDKKGVSHKIPLNWDNAMKWRDWACDEFGYTVFKQAMLDIKQSVECRKKLPFDLWLASFAQPEHYLQAAAIAKLNAEKGKK